MSPFTAWIMLKGLETMDLRVRAQATTALAWPSRSKATPASSA
jgi:cystathionine beta-lyase/cystathionine gamma-synthase